MYQNQRRQYPRDTFEAPILISEKPDGHYTDALMQNNSRSGMCLICQYQLDSGTGIYINMSETGYSNIYRGFFGRVTWCRGLTCPEDYNDRFGVGIHFIVKSHNYFGGIGCMIDECCDVCGEKISFDKLMQTDDAVFQCRNCHDALKKYPEGKLKSSITNYILGNIL
ncbi:MAG: PilZ domain-containing protein [Proteobacteria bacterium]|nr:PilZ domain-containing protein [Pseudomonadota bacterium]